MNVWYNRTEECQKNTSLSEVNEIDKPIVNYPSVSSRFYLINSKYIDRETCFLPAVAPVFHYRHCRGKFSVEKAHFVVILNSLLYRDGTVMD